MTHFVEKSFSVPASGGSPAYCAKHGHTLPDQRGKCLRCSAKVRIASGGLVPSAPLPRNEEPSATPMVVAGEASHCNADYMPVTD